MPKYNCPYPNCAYSTDNVSDELAAVMLRIHAEGAHLATQQKPAKVETVRRPVVVSGAPARNLTITAISLPARVIINRQ